MAAIPLMIDLKNKNIVVVGGGKIAERRVRTLLNSETNIKVISPSLTSSLTTLHQEGKLDWHEKPFSTEDLQDAFLIVAATNDSAVNQAIIEAAPKNTLLNSVEDAASGNIQFPTQFSRGKLSISVSTNGSSPILAAKIKRDLAVQYDEKYEDYLDFLFEARQLIKSSSLSTEKKKQWLRRLVEEDHFHPEDQEFVLKQLNNIQ
ncbi:NAD(P)-binding protein [Halobacillus sp. A1]|uniref:NAD(P)-binding protein n=1 Tax=Halobacillus sp. A1 TaxID=2880262 RepID=UPI0020A67004|nr:NAD(P)-binding protein [Halobacillus sp. A1]MCP3030020.1 NAD(P)-binding protein [Halobacillus sp. A1]